MIETTPIKRSIMPDGLIIRQAVKADLPALEWDGEFQHYRRMYASVYQNTHSGTALMWVAETEEHETIGQAFVMLVSSEKSAADGKNRAYVFAFRVKPAWRRGGVGSDLMAFIEEDLQQRGFKAVTLNVAKDNRGALRLYRRLGYHVIGSKSGRWSYQDHQGVVRHVNEPSWRMIKKISAGR